MACLPQLVNALEQFMRSKYFTEKSTDECEDLSNDSKIDDVTHATTSISKAPDEISTKVVDHDNQAIPLPVAQNLVNGTNSEEKSCFTMIGHTQPLEGNSNLTSPQFFASSDPMENSPGV